MKHLGRYIGLAAAASFAAIMAIFIGDFLALLHPVSPPPPLGEAVWLWTYRGFDVIFLCLIIFVAIVGAAVLFREARPVWGLADEG